jgi:hypothetical protein
MIRATATLCLAVAFALLSPVGRLGAAVLIDPFADGALVGGSDNSGLDWYRRSSNQVISIMDDAAGIGSGNALRLTIPGGTQIDRAVLGSFSAFSLVNVGDKLSLSFDFRFEVNPTVNTPDGFRFGFYNSNGSLVTADATTQSDNDFGYQVSIGTGSSAGFDIKKETNVGAGGTGSDNPTPDRATIGPTLASTGSINNTLKHTGSFTITRSATGVTFSAALDGTTLGAGSNNTAPFLTFDEVMISHGTPQAFRIDNVNVTTESVPEPATMGLLGVGIAGLCGRRKRLAK